MMLRRTERPGRSHGVEDGRVRQGRPRPDVRLRPPAGTETGPEEQQDDEERDQPGMHGAKCIEGGRLSMAAGAKSFRFAGLSPRGDPRRSTRPGWLHDDRNLIRLSLPPLPMSDSAPTVHTIALTRPFVWLARAWQDMTRIGWLSLAHGLVLACFGAAIVAIAHNRFWLLAGALSGFLVIAPVLATSLYALSRTLERGETPSAGVVARTWLNWQQSHFDKWGNDYWCMVQFGFLLSMAATGWVLVSAALITLLAPVPIQTPADFLRHVVLAKQGGLFELWLALGAVLAAPMFASSVVTMPLLLDRRLSLLDAVLTSWQAVLANPIPLGLWATLIAGLTLLGLCTALLGLIPLIPLLGHASWHAYRDLVDASAFPARDPSTTSTNARAPR